MIYCGDVGRIVILHQFLGPTVNALGNMITNSTDFKVEVLTDVTPANFVGLLKL